MNQSRENNLIHEKSPYLLQHADNPVNWYAWGEEAFAAAVREDKPILLSIGYSTCHWCHVMAEESFSDPAIGDIMNRAFISIKLDREERPDIDQIYISAVSALNGSAGWPLNVFLTPEGRPFYGGTYFPPDNRPGLPSWREVLSRVEGAWHDPDMKKKILTSAEDIAGTLKRHLAAAATGPADQDQPDADTLVTSALTALSSRFDKTNGGFGPAPKFPMPPMLNFLLVVARLGNAGHISAQPGEAARDMVSQTLKAMAAGGIFDQIGGGFHRYSTDARWHLPHFEKMLYDNAQLATVLLDAQAFIDDSWPSRTAATTLDYMLRDMMHPEGGFYSAEDADSYPDQAGGSKREGAFYGWRLEEVQALLPGETARILAHYYGLRPDGNVKDDPFKEFNNINVPFQASDLSETAAFFNLTEEKAREALSRGRQILFEARQQRPRPHLDDKILSGWNGLALTALSRGYLILGRKEYLEAAQKTARFIRQNLYDETDGSLLRRWRDGRGDIPGLAEDYILLAQGLCDLYQAGFDPGHLKWALDLADQFYDLFFDESQGTCYAVTAEHDRHLIFRPRDDQDNVMPSATSTAAMVFLRLAGLTGDTRWDKGARALFNRARTKLADQPLAAPQMLAALGQNLSGLTRVVISGAADRKETRLLLETTRSARPNAEIVLVDSPETWQLLKDQMPTLTASISPDKTPRAYVCSGHTCLNPVTEPDQLRDLITPGQPNPNIS